MVKLVYSVTTLACNSDREFSQEKLFYILKTFKKGSKRNVWNCIHIGKKHIQVCIIWSSLLIHSYCFGKNAWSSVELYTSLLRGNVFCSFFPSVCTGQYLSCSPLHILCPLLYSHLLLGCSFYLCIHSASYSLYPCTWLLFLLVHFLVPPPDFSVNYQSPYNQKFSLSTVGKEVEGLKCKNVKGAN